MTFSDFLTAFSAGLANSGATGGLAAGARGYTGARKSIGLKEASKFAEQGDWNGAVETLRHYDPQSAFQLSQELKAVEDEQKAKTQITPYQQQMLDLQREQLRQNSVPSSIKELQYVNAHPELKELYVQSKKGVNINNNLNPFEKKRIENIASKIDKNISDATERLASYDRADQLLDKVDTGGFAGIAHKATPEDFMTADVSELNGLMNKLAPQQRPAGSGTTSDKDMDIYKKATISWGKDNQANKSIVAMGKAMAQNDIAHEELRAQWISNGGNTTDFDKLWRKYANEQRIYNNDGSINQNRVDPYEWFANMGNMTDDTGDKQEQPRKSKYTIVEVK